MTSPMMIAISSMAKVSTSPSDPRATRATAANISTSAGIGIGTPADLINSTAAIAGNP
jgi:hypothetical protein